MLFFTTKCLWKMEIASLSLTPDAPRQPLHPSSNAHRAVRCCADLLSWLLLIGLALSFQAEPDVHCSTENTSGFHFVDVATVSECLASVHLPSSVFKRLHSAVRALFHHPTQLLTRLLMELFPCYVPRTTSLWTLLHLARDEELGEVFLCVPVPIKVSPNRIFPLDPSIKRPVDQILQTWQDQRELMASFKMLWPVIHFQVNVSSLLPIGYLESPLSLSSLYQIRSQTLMHLFTCKYFKK